MDASPAGTDDALIAGKYKLVRLLGRGGMGSVWEGVHAAIGTRVALKFIEAEVAHQPEVRERFFKEALAAARLRSKHIVQVYDSGVDQGGRPYIVMEFLSGEPLDERLVREGTLSLADASAILQQLARAMDKAHAAGIVHRDLKPENIYLVWDEEDQRDLVKVVDFGIAKFTDGSGISSATRTGAVLGTPHFMSPEQARGLKNVDQRADVWSIGVIAYRAVTGALPFDGEGIGDLLVKICTTEPQAPSEHVPLPREFDAWIARSLAKDPDKRFASVSEQAAALRAFADAADQGAAGSRIEASPKAGDTVLGVERDHLGGRRVSPLSVFAGLSVVLVVLVVWLVFVSSEESAPDVATSAAGDAPVAPALPGPAAAADSAPAERAEPSADTAALSGGTEALEPAQGQGGAASSAQGQAPSRLEGADKGGRSMPRENAAQKRRPASERPPPAPSATASVEDELGY